MRRGVIKVLDCVILGADHCWAKIRGSGRQKWAARD